MHLKFLISTIASILCFCSIAQSPAETERNAFEACKGTQNPVEEYDCLSSYLKGFPNGAYQGKAQKRLEELNNVPKNALKKALETAQRTKNCELLERFEKRYAYSLDLAREAALKKNEICPPSDPCAGIRNFNNLYLSQCLAILRNPLAGAACKEEARKRILAIEDGYAKALNCDNAARYLERFPEGRYRAKADSILRLCTDSSEIAWQRLRSGSVGDLKAFLATFPSSHRRLEAQKALDILDDRTWESALQSNTATGFDNYLKEFPKGKHAKEAKAALDKQKKSGDNQEDIAFLRAFKSSDGYAMTAFLDEYPDSRYKSIALREIKRRLPPRYFITKIGNTYTVAFQNLENPRILNMPDLSDSLVADLSQINSNQITFMPLQEGLFTIQIEDEWQKTISFSINTAQAPFSGDMTVQNDTLYVMFFNAPPPFTVQFSPAGDGKSIRIEGVRDSIAKFALSDLYSIYGLRGEYLVSIEKNIHAYAELFNVKVFFPRRYWIYTGCILALLTTSAFLIRWQLRVRRIRRKMRALR